LFFSHLDVGVEGGRGERDELGGFLGGETMDERVVG